MRSRLPAALTGSEASSIVKKALREQAVGVLMFTRSLSVLACLMLAGAVGAQVATTRPAPAKRVLGKATDVNGLITVSDQWNVSRVVVNTPVVEHSRFVTSSSGSVTLRMDDGCDIELKPNQALTFDRENSCSVLWASIESLGNSTGMLGASGLAGGLLGAGASGPFAAGELALLLMGNRGAGGNTLGGGAGAQGGGGNLPNGSTPGGGNPADNGGNPPGGGPGTGDGATVPVRPPDFSPQ
jgi:hypothetical protein